MFERLMEINSEAFDNQLFDAAYHVLAGAFHCAESAGNEQQILQVAQRATEQLTVIDRHHPKYRHSTQSATQRGHASIFHLLARQASAKERIVHLEHTSSESDPPTLRPNLPTDPQS